MVHVSPSSSPKSFFGLQLSSRFLSFGASDCRDISMSDFCDIEMCQASPSVRAPSHLFTLSLFQDNGATKWPWATKLVRTIQTLDKWGPQGKPPTLLHVSFLLDLILRICSTRLVFPWGMYRKKGGGETGKEAGIQMPLIPRGREQRPSYQPLFEQPGARLPGVGSSGLDSQV